MIQQNLIELMNGDTSIGVKEFVAMHDYYMLCLATHEQGYSHEQLEYITAYVKFLEDRFMEEL